ncbi:Mitochondrial carrier domain superfamily [Sesbania bispinosa]|nr:Mitochondrial carrier domain superfamily [Sesbania bispinosa]
MTTLVDVMSQRLMVQGGCNSSNPKASDFRYINGIDAFRKIMSIDGLRGLWESHHLKLNAAMTTQLVWTLVDVVSQRLMVQGGCNSNNPKASDFRYINGIDAFRKIMNTEKWEEHH